LKEKLADDLEKKIEQRPAKDELIEHNIMKATTMDPSLQSAAIALEKHKLEENLAKKIQERPDPQELKEKNILS